MFDGDTLAGAATFSNFVPFMDICLHVAVDRQYRGLWASRGVLRTLCEYAFVGLDLPRVSSYAVQELTPHAAHALQRVGFNLEGVKRHAARYPDGYHDLMIFGMLREECRWI